MRHLFFSALAAIGLVTPSFAEDLAVIIANDNYRTYPDVPEARNFAGLRRDFEQAGYVVTVLPNTTSAASYNQTTALWQRMASADRLIIAMSGHVVRTRGQNWLLHTDAKQMTALTVGQYGLPIEPFFDLVGARPGEAVLIVADSGAALSLGVGVHAEPTVRGIPQGVTYIEGEPAIVANFVANELLRPGQSVAEAKQYAPQGVRVAGFVPRAQGIVSYQDNRPTPGQIEQSLWDQARQANTVDAYQNYLNRYPQGRFAAEANQRKAALSLTPQDRARIAEEQLRLSRDQRRQIQRQLTLLGFDTRGVDGVLGRNSRNAISRWQRSVGNTQTGYLTANQINRIQASAEIRAEELRIEAERRRLEQERNDRNYWSQTGAGGTESGLQAYLQRYPDGVFSQQARKRLKQIDRERRRQAEAAERQAWDKAVMLGTIDSYRNYLGTYPRGLFAPEAKARINALRSPETLPDLVDAAKAEEARLSLNGFTRKLIEAQLRSLNLNPGPVDGRFTPETRRALRKYQRANNQTVTGFVTRDTIVTLLASAIE